MLTRRATFWAAVGLAGTCILGISFAINSNGPPAGASGAQLAAFGQQHHDAILWGAWLQAVGPVLIVVFAQAARTNAQPVTDDLRATAWQTAPEDEGRGRTRTRTRTDEVAGPFSMIAVQPHRPKACPMGPLNVGFRSVPTPHRSSRRSPGRTTR